VGGEKVRGRSESFQDHFTQAGMFFRSMSKPEREHIIAALLFELGKVERKEVRERVVEQILAKIDTELVTQVAEGLGLPVPKPAVVKGKIDKSPALSMENQKKDSIKTRLVGALVADGFDAEDLAATRSAIEKAGGQLVIIAKRLGTVKGSDGQPVKVDKSALTTASVEYDAVFVPGGAASVAVLKKDGDSLHFVQEAYRHCKAIGVTQEATELLEAGGLSTTAPGIVVGTKGAKHHSFPSTFIESIAQHRHWNRLDRNNIPA